VSGTVRVVPPYLLSKLLSDGRRVARDPRVAVTPAEDTAFVISRHHFG
jgi:hypothetical protein